MRRAVIRSLTFDSDEVDSSPVNYQLTTKIKGSDVDVPLNYQQAIRSAYENYWIKAAQEEIDQFVEKDVYELVERPPDAKVIPCSILHRSTRATYESLKEYCKI